MTDSAHMDARTHARKYTQSIRSLATTFESQVLPHKIYGVSVVLFNRKRST